MMFSYRRAKYGLIFATIAVGAIATIGIASTKDNDAGNFVNDLFNTFQSEGSVSPLGGGNDGGQMPTSIISLLGGGNDGGQMPTSTTNLLGGGNDGGQMPT